MREGFFAGRQWSDIDDLNAQAATWCLVISANRPCPEEPSLTVREAFERLVALYGTPAAGSPAIGAGDAGQNPGEDILGAPRSGRPDLGAVQR